MIRRIVVGATLLGLGTVAAAQDDEEISSALDLNAELSWSIVRTELKEVAGAYVGKLVPNLPADKILGGQSWAMYAAPFLDVKTGGEDVLDSATVKAQGFYWPALEPGLKCETIHLFPYSVGAESTSGFDKIAAVAEIGWSPIGPCSDDEDRFGLRDNRRVGLFLQGGYLFDERDSSSPEGVGGVEDESEEGPDEAVARVKADVRYAFDLGTFAAFKPSATGWYDVRNDAFYYHVETAIRLNIVPGKYFVDLKYEKGSGSPNFNEGDQFGIGLAVVF